MKKNIGRIGIVIAAMSSLVFSNVTITVNENTTYQTIEGIGGQHIGTWKVANGPFFVDADLDKLHLYDTLIQDLGITLVRDFMSGDFELQQGKYAISPGMRSIYTYRKKLQEAGLRSGVNVKFIGSIICSPAYMKYSKLMTGGGGFDPAYYNDFAKFINKYLQTAKDTFGITHSAFSPQNEPFFDEPYEQVNYYTPENYKAMFKAVIPQVKTANPNLKFFFPEHMGQCGWNTCATWDAILHDSATAKYADVGAVHGYLDGIAPDLGSADGWVTMSDNLKAHNRPLWMTETSGIGGLTFDNCMTLTKQMFAAFKYGKITGWCYLNIVSGSGGTEDVFVAGGKKTWLYFATKHFARFFRPGDKQVDCTSNDVEVQPLVFFNNATQSVALLLVNSGSTAKVVDLTINGSVNPSNFDLYRTSSTEKCELKGKMSKSGIQLPAKSITTLYSGPSFTTSVHPLKTEIATLQHQTRYSQYTLNGKYIALDKMGSKKSLAHSGVLLYKAGNGKVIPKVITKK